MTYGMASPHEVMKAAHRTRELLTRGTPILDALATAASGNRKVWYELRTSFVQAAGASGFDSISALQRDGSRQQTVGVADEVLTYWVQLVAMSATD